MKTLSFSLLVVLSGLSARAAITGQWDFENGDLNATIGSPMQYRGTTASQTQFGATTALGVANINGEVGRVLRFPACSSSQGYVLPHGAAPNGGGSRVNQYTLILDALFPSTSTGFRAFWQTNTNNTSDADLFVNGANGIGISGVYECTVTANAWHRIVFVFDLPYSTLKEYIDGTLVGTQTLSAGLDGRWSLDPFALLSGDEDGDIAPACANSIQFRNGILTDGEVAALGGATSVAGIPGAVPRIRSITRSGSNVIIT